jgi:hypothetical protein
LPILTVEQIRKVIKGMPGDAQVEVDYKYRNRSTRIPPHDLTVAKGRGTLLGKKNIIITANDYDDVY